MIFWLLRLINCWLFYFSKILAPLLGSEFWFELMPVTPWATTAPAPPSSIICFCLILRCLSFFNGVTFLLLRAALLSSINYSSSCFVSNTGESSSPAAYAKLWLSFCFPLPGLFCTFYFWLFESADVDCSATFLSISTLLVFSKRNYWRTNSSLYSLKLFFRNVL